MLPDNYSLSKSRLASLLSRLRNDLECSKSIMQLFRCSYSGTVERWYSSKGEEDCAGEVGEVHYLAHRPVVPQDKQTTKVRVV